MERTETFTNIGEKHTEFGMYTDSRLYISWEDGTIILSQDSVIRLYDFLKNVIGNFCVPRAHQLPLDLSSSENDPSDETS
jgi:hypothetical protein